MVGITFDKEKIHVNLARLKKGGKNFEVVIDPDKAVEYKEKKEIEIKEVLKSQEIFSDAKKGMAASDNDIKQIFETDDPLKIAGIIIGEGEIQLTQDHRDKLRTDKKNRILNIIQVNAVDPQTHNPHTLERLESALEQSKFKIDEFKSAEQQVQDVVKAMTPVIPIKFEIKEIEVKIPSQYAAKSYGLVKGFGKILKEEWLNDGSWFLILEMPGGLEVDFYEKLNSFCHGTMEAKVIKVK